MYFPGIKTNTFYKPSEVTPKAVCSFVNVCVLQQVHKAFAALYVFLFGVLRFSRPFFVFWKGICNGKLVDGLDIKQKPLFHTVPSRSKGRLYLVPMAVFSFVFRKKAFCSTVWISFEGFCEFSRLFCFWEGVFMNFVWCYLTSFLSAGSTDTGAI